MSRQGKNATLIACAGATATTVMLAAPATCSAAPPISRPTVSYTIWTETELTAPTKQGKLRRRKGGGGGDGDEGGDHLDDAAGSGGNFDGFDGGFDGGDGGGGDGDWSNHHWNSRGSGGGGGGGGGDDWWGDGSWLNDGGGLPEDGNLMWAWQTICGVTFAGSVHHLVERSVPLVSNGWSALAAGDGATASAARETAAVAAAAATGGGCAMEAVGEVVNDCVETAAGRAGLVLASMTTAHLARHQPVLSMSISVA